MKSRIGIWFFLNDEWNKHEYILSPATTARENLLTIYAQFNLISKSATRSAADPQKMQK